jgi:hypothetical protein
MVIFLEKHANLLGILGRGLEIAAWWPLGIFDAIASNLLVTSRVKYM